MLLYVYIYIYIFMLLEKQESLQGSCVFCACHPCAAAMLIFPVSFKF